MRFIRKGKSAGSLKNKCHMTSHPTNSLEHQFSNPNVDLDYQTSKQKYHSLFLKLLILYGFFICFINWILNPMQIPGRFEAKSLIRIVIYTFVSLTILIIGWKRPLASKYLILFVAYFYFFFTMEINLNENPRWNSTLQLLSGMNIKVILIQILLARISWKIASFVFLTINLFYSFRYIEIEAHVDMNFYPLIQLIQNSLILSIFAWILEKFEKENYQKIHTYEYSLLRFKELITNYFPSGVIIFKDDKILFNNERATTLLNVSNDGIDLLIKLRSLRVLDPVEIDQKELCFTEDAKPIIKSFNFEDQLLGTHILHHGRVRSLPHAVCCSYEFEGESVDVEIQITKIVWENKECSMIIMSENEMIKKMKVVSQQSEYKDRLLATVSHDLRTPLNGVMGMINLGMEIEDEILRRKYLNVALRSSKLLLFMINDILDYSQIANGKLRLSRETFSLWNVIKEVSKLFKFQTKQKGIAFSKVNHFAKSEKPAKIHSDQNRIKQVLFNLLGNALKFTPKGSIKIALKPWPSERGQILNNEFSVFNDAFLISVEDTGIGIKKEDQQHLFKLFGKINNEASSSLNKSGVGLGLAISQSLVKIMNKNKPDGVIRVESELGKGSCFSFVIYSFFDEETYEDFGQAGLHEKSEKEMAIKLRVLDRKLDFERKSKSPKTNALKRLTLASKNKIRILAVDDDQINIIVVSSYLRALQGYEFDVASDGEEAISKIKLKAQEEYYYDAILMDFNMPRMDGLEASMIIDRMIKNDEIPTVVLIVCTANAHPKDYIVPFCNGKLDHITKPFSKEELKRKLDVYFS